MSRKFSCLLLTLTLLLASGCSDNGGDADVDADADTDVDADADTDSDTDGGLSVTLESEPARIVIQAPNGSTLLESLPGGTAAPYGAAAFRQASVDYQMLFGSHKLIETAGDWHGVTAFTNVVQGEDGTTFELTGPDGPAGSGEIREVAPGTLQVILRGTTGNRATAAFRCAPDEHFLGFGEQTHDVDHRGQTVPLWVSEQGITKRDDDEVTDAWMVEGRRHSSYFPVPFFLSSKGYGILADTFRKSVFAMCSENSEAWRIEAWEGELSFHVFYGPGPYDVMRRHTDVVGRAPVPPPVTFAPWNDAIYGEDNVRRVAQLIRDEGIPSSAIWSEDWGGARTVGDNYELDQNWTLDRAVYPNVEGLAAELEDLGFHWFGYFNTFITNGDDHWDAAEENGYWIFERRGDPYTFQGVRFETTSLVDLTNPDAADWLYAHMETALELGFDGWMADYAEWLPADCVLHSGEDAWEVHNRYPLLWQSLNEKLFDAAPGGDDRLTFVRSGYTGSQAIRHQVVWAGDQSTDFAHGDGLPTIIPMGIGLGVCGFPYYGHDIAGYMSQGTDPSTKELFFRWTTLGALSPIMRTHHGHSAYANWSFEKDPETIAHFKRWATLHIQLYPYFLGLAELAAETGAPIFRAMALEFPDDEATWSLLYQYMLGPAILVAPVVVEGATARDVYFPAGHWIPLLGGTAVDGPGTVNVNAPLSEIPAFVRRGTVLALLPDDVKTLVPAGAGVKSLCEADDDREVWAYLGAAGEFSESSGQSYTLTSSEAAAGSLDWNGAALSTCADPPVAPCGQVDGNTAVAHVTGDGTLALGTSTLATGGGDVERKLVLRLFW